MLFSILILAILLISLIGARNVFAAHLQGITLVLTGRKRLGLYLYSFIFLPGVVIHEISHFFVAAFLGVRTGDITIFPSGKTESGSQRLGSVQIAKTDIVRGSIIGIAPLIIGSLAIIALTLWQFPQLIQSVITLEGTLNQLLVEGRQILTVPLNLVWVYLIFAISNTMFTSQSDRRSWPALIIVLFLLTVVAVWSGIASPIASAIREPVIIGVSILTAGFFVSLVIDVIFLAPLLLLEKLIAKARKKRITYP